MKGLLALVLIAALAVTANSQECSGNSCAFEQRPTLAPALPAVMPAMRSILESHTIRRAAIAPLRYANQKVVQPTFRYGSNAAIRIIRTNRSFR